jgi:hypothetical protein
MAAERPGGRGLMPARVIEDPLAVEFTFSDASRFTLPLSHLPCPELVAGLLQRGR